MTRRNNKKPKLKIVLYLIGGIVGLVALFLFMVGLVSLISMVPGITTTEEVKIVAANTKTANVSELREVLYNKNITLESLSESSRSGVIIGKIKDGPEVYFSSVKDSEFQANSLQLILSKLTIDNKKPKVIDLRLERPIVKY